MEFDEQFNFWQCAGCSNSFLPASASDQGVTTVAGPVNRKLARFLELLKQNGLFPDCDDFADLSTKDLDRYWDLLEEIQALGA